MAGVPGGAGGGAGDVGGVTVLVLVRRVGGEPTRPELARLLPGERYRALEHLLVHRALAWAAEVAPGRVLAAVSVSGPGGGVRELLADSVAEVLPLAGGGTPGRAGEGGPGEVGTAIAAAFSTTTGPLLVVWPELPCWRAPHAAAALGDLDAGCGVSVGPVFDGGLYLMALARPVPELLERVDDSWSGAEAMGLALAAAHETGLEVGLLRAERGLRRQADLRAALADPLLDGELAGVLGGI